MYVTSVPDNAKFDYVIVGSGSAGCALANRLTADRRHQVLLLEAGGRDTNYNIHVPMFVANVLNDTRWTWPLHDRAAAAPERQSAEMDARPRDRRLELDQRQSLRPRRPEGIRQVARRAAAAGGASRTCCRYSSGSRIFPKAIPRCAAAAARSIAHGSTTSTRSRMRSSTRAARRVTSVLEDYNDGSYEGAFYLQYSTRRGLRNSSAVGYLKPAIKRPNLTVLTNATATRVLMDGKRATGVEYPRRRYDAAACTRSAKSCSPPVRSPRRSCSSFRASATATS